MELSGQLYAPADITPVSIYEEVGWAPEVVWTLWKREKSFYAAGNRTPAVQSVAN
jgi:hypothetical protein